MKSKMSCVFLSFVFHSCKKAPNKLFSSKLQCEKKLHIFYFLDTHKWIKTFFFSGKRRFNIKLWKTFTDCFNCLPIAAIVDEKIFCCHGGLSPDLQSMEQIRRIMRPTDVPDTGKKFLQFHEFFTQMLTNNTSRSVWIRLFIVGMNE